MSELPAARTVMVNGIKINYVDVPAGPDAKPEAVPIIMIHGGGPGAGGLSNYRKNMLPLSQQARVLVPDMPGWGSSDNTLPAGSIYEELAKVTLGFMDALGVAKADFIGNSMGGGTSLKTAVMAPDRVNKMVLMGTGGALHPFSMMPSEGQKRMIEFYLGTGPSLAKMQAVVDLLVYDPSAITPALMQERVDAATRPDVLASPPTHGRFGHPADMIWKDPLHLLEHETLVIWGREDRVMPVDGAAPLAKMLPNAELHVFPKCGHWAQWEKADQFNILVSEFFKR